MKPARVAIATAIGLLSVALSTALPAAPAGASAPLREHAAAKGKFIGTALATGPLASESAYRTIAATEFDQVTAENAMKWDATQPSQGQFTFSGADQIVAFAAQNNQQVHGHTLVWHSQTPGWVQNLSAAQLRTAMQNHISTVVGRYADNPVVRSWDVVNEAFEENGSYRNSFWYQKLGEGYIADAFRFARAADPDAKLCINDYNVEGINAKSTAMYNLVRTLRQQGVPIDCVGFQAHLAIQYGFPGDVQQNMQRFADLGVDVRLTEIDVRMQMPRDATKDATQATYYRNLVNACLAVTRCVGMTIWGFTDKHSWVPDTFQGQGAALIYDENYGKKPSYNAVHDALAGGTSNDTQKPTRPGKPAVSDVTGSSARVTWTASTDNVGVTGYDVYSGTTKLAGATTNAVTLTGLSPNTSYTVHVVARDAAGNTSDPSDTTSFTTTGTPAGDCTATYRLVNSWPGGFQAEVSVTSTRAITGWTVGWTFPGDQKITQLWNGTHTQTGATVSVKNASWNGRPPATFGFTASGAGATPSGVTCTAQ
ncbi:endo-1,4-beta-xylanase [Thermoactinospora rubra]|uniref:endo-1,4-beta-xylanase n=1 Tax=Thermoactinospora rubra TaxID=1088767 RepID=UPI001F0B3C61|nr:endo-1,4-beta-xylanase [Thermoactinospora rubra]